MSDAHPSDTAAPDTEGSAVPAAEAPRGRSRRAAPPFEGLRGAAMSVLWFGDEAAEEPVPPQKGAHEAA